METTHAAPSEAMTDQMEAQLSALYAERETLHNALGVSNADDVVRLVRSLEAQLNDLYNEKENQQ